jgi:hypothetical protein
MNAEDQATFIRLSAENEQFRKAPKTSFSVGILKKDQLQGWNISSHGDLVEFKFDTGFNDVRIAFDRPMAKMLGRTLSSVNYELALQSAVETLEHAAKLLRMEERTLKDATYCETLAKYLREIGK